MKFATIGVDVGGTNIKLGLVHPQGKVIARTSVATQSFTSHKTKLIAALAREIGAMMAANGLNRNNVGGVGIGLPGLIDYAQGMVGFLPNIPGWRNVPLAALLRQKLRLPVFIDNDVKLIALAEWKFGAGKKTSDLICLTLGTGVGSALILNNRLYRGPGNSAGELGHVPLNEQGPACNCGGFGCLETYIGNRRLVARANTMMGRKNMTLEAMHALAAAGNGKALAFWKETGEHLGNALVAVVNLLNPQKIIIGGGVSNNYKFIFKTVRDVLDRRAMSTPAGMVKIVRASLGDDAGILGAHVMVHNAHES